MIIKIEMDNADNAVIERGWYEYNASRDIISYLMKQDLINEEYLQQYINIAERRFVELEMKKNEVAYKYLPDDISREKMAQFYFDFENSIITYTIED